MTNDQADAIRRKTACESVIADALRRFSCILVPETIITGNQVTASVRILARPVTYQEETPEDA